uniref:DNA 5'-3' helicase n=2 Tax=Caenorhabditis japonica TaxID=281687 RepID=A0A8R1HMI6_CAEJA
MDEFSFPFPPYDIQLCLMREIRDCIEHRKVGIFESPTGTGKSLSVLCSTMTWLEEEEQRIDRDLEQKLRATRRKIEDCDKETEEDWVEVEKKKMVARKEEDEFIEQIEERKRLKDRIEQAKNGVVGVSRKRKTPATKDFKLEDDEDEEPKDELAPSEEYHSDGEARSTRATTSEFSDDDEEEKEKPLKCLKIFYASRTHSQLEQLVEELAKTRFRPRVVTCASRGTLCVNEDVKKLKLNHLINEKCMELRKKESGDGGKKLKTEEGAAKTKKKTCKTTCEFYNCTQIEDVVNGVLANKLTTTLQVTKQGKIQQGCPYFATRKAVPQCQLVLLPYQVLLHDGTRQAWGIDLKDNVVILDEAHNVLSTISSLYSAEISTKSLILALRLIREYIETYKLRLKAKNLLYMKQLESLSNKMLLFLNGQSKEEVMTMAQFARHLNILEMNLFKLATYVEKTDLCKKFHGFYLRMQRNEVKKENEKPKLTGIQKLMAKKEEVNEKEDEKAEERPPPRPVPSPLFSLKSFIDALTNKCEDGRFVVERSPTEAKFRFMLLNPADRLAEVVNSCRATVLVGGTMEPAQLLVETLSRGSIGSDSIRRFSCAHVIDDSQLLAVTVEKTINGKPFQLTYQTRNDDSVLKSLALSIQTLIPHLPNGVVIFLPSYDFLYNFQKKMKEFGVMERIEQKKSVFTESRLPTSDVWERFSRAARSPKGAIFFAVVGGKMSEGINFCDELGRAVIVIGLPYPNKTSVELKERMRFLDAQMPNGGSLLYESLCMHAVNQAIGRAIRHRKDYAAVYLFDERYAKESTRSKFSAWIGDRTQTNLQFGEIIRKTRAFFDGNKATN